MAEAEWYYATGGQQHGPVSIEQLRQLVALGQITPRDLVWRDGMANWMPIGSALGSAPAPLPVAQPVDLTPGAVARKGDQAERQWYYARGGEQHGPVPAQEIQQLLTAGQLTSQDLVWRDGMTNWRPIVSGPHVLFAHFPSGATA